MAGNGGPESPTVRPPGPGDESRDPAAEEGVEQDPLRWRGAKASVEGGILLIDAAPEDDGFQDSSLAGDKRSHIDEDRR